MSQVKDEYELEFWKATHTSSQHMVAYNWILNFWGLKETKSILEIGTGPLSGILPLISSEFKVGVDPLYETFIREDLFFRHLDIHYIQGQVETIAFNYLFKTIVTINALDHGESTFDSIDNLVSLLEVNGKLYIHVNLRRLDQLNLGHDHMLTLDDFNSVVSRNNLKIHSHNVFESDPLQAGSPYNTLIVVLEKL